MTTALSASLRPLFAGKTVGTDDIRAAVALVTADTAGHASAAPLAAFVDAFVAANGEGRVSATTRQAFEAALVKLVDALPKTASSVLVRQDEASLTRGIATTTTTIDKQTTRIGTLQSEVQTLKTAVATKKAEATRQLETQTSLQTSLAASKKAEQNNLFLAVFVMALTGGKSGGAPANVFATVDGVKTAMSLNDINTRLSQLASEIPRTRATVVALEAQLAVAEATVAAQEQALAGLQVLETALRTRVAATTTTATTTTPTSTTLSARLSGLAVSLEAQQALSANLGKQIDVLEAMKAGLTTTNATLDAVLVALHAENDGLRAEIAASQRAIKSSLIDMALSTSGFAKRFDIGALSVSTKDLLLDGVDGLRLAVLRQARALANDAITNAALGVSSSSPAGQLLLAALDGDRNSIDAAARGVVDSAVSGVVDDGILAAAAAHGFDSASSRVMLAALRNDPSGARRAALDGVLDGLDTLSAPQRFLIEQLLFAPRTTTSPVSSDVVLQVITRAAADATLDDKRARALAALVTGSDRWTVFGNRDPLVRYMSHSAEVAIGEAAPTTTSLTLYSTTDTSLGRLGHLPLQALEIRGHDHSEAGVRAALSSLPALTSLALSSDVGLEAALDVPQLEHLKAVGTPAQLARVVAALPALSSLGMSWNRDIDDSCLATIATLPALRTLEVMDSGITGTGFAASALAGRVSSLHLGFTKQQPADLVALANVAGLTTLNLHGAELDHVDDLLLLGTSSSLQEVRLGLMPAAEVARLNAALGRPLFA